jgi:hypothetical protein
MVASKNLIRAIFQFWQHLDAVASKILSFNNHTLLPVSIRIAQNTSDNHYAWHPATQSLKPYQPFHDITGCCIGNFTMIHNHLYNHLNTLDQVTNCSVFTTQSICNVSVTSSLTCLQDVMLARVAWDGQFPQFITFHALCIPFEPLMPNSLTIPPTV